jgi:hypothetical protein
MREFKAKESGVEAPLRVQRPLDGLGPSEAVGLTFEEQACNRYQTVDIVAEVFLNVKNRRAIVPTQKRIIG